MVGCRPEVEQRPAAEPGGQRRCRGGMRRLGVLAVLVLAAVGLVPAAPAQAGGWAVTLLDPLPDRIEAGRAYTVGYWVLQHGSHPFDGELGKTGLRLVGPGGEREFVGNPLPEAAHYAVSFAVPAGTWRVTALQGWFAPFEVGSLTVPGTLTLRPSEMAVAVGGHSDGGPAPHWGAVHPPSRVGDGQAAPVQSALDPAAAPARPATAPAPAPPAAPQPRIAVAIGLLAGCGLLALLATRPARRHLRRRT
jgi:hypothetical protein